MHKNLIKLFKWWWRFSESDNKLRKRILKSVYDIKGLKASSETFSKVREGTLSHLLSKEDETSKIRSIIEDDMLIKVGNGSSVRFWHDNWCEAGILKRIFPRLFAISLQKNLFISQMGDWIEGSWAWDLRWRRILYDWENDEVLRLIQFIEQKRPNRDKEDGVYWKYSGNLCYPIKSIRAKMNEAYTPTFSKPIIDIVWQKFIPPRAQFSVWLANLEKLKTGDFLVEKGIIDS